MRLTYHPPAELDGRVREEIWSFYSRFSVRERDGFEQRLSASEEVFLGRLADGRIVAFGVIDVLHGRLEGTSYGVLFTNWAAVDPEFRGSNLIQRAGLRSFWRFKRRHPLRRVYWLFGASTYKSYLLLARNFPRFWPRRGHAWPAREKGILLEVMARKADPGWDPDRGVVRRHGASRYLEGVVAHDPAALADPDVAFFHEANPDQGQGDTLMCLCPLTLGSWLSVAWRAVGRARRRRAG